MTELQKFTNCGSFVFYPDGKRGRCFRDCNAPADQNGIYVIYGVRSNEMTLLYIGISGNLRLRKSGYGGLKGRLIDGKQRGIPRYKFWINSMCEDGFPTLLIEWFATFEGSLSSIEDELIKKYQPKWNIKGDKGQL